jgi:3',5'-cyclic AMP phosphodiesterase CpdA
MAWTPRLTDLLAVLMELYPTPDHAAIVAADAGLDRARIPLGGSPEQFWHAILREAERQGAVRRLAEIAARDYPSNVALARWLAEPESSVETRPSSIDTQIANSRAEKASPFRVFVSYSRRDQQYRDELELHCASLVRQGRVEIWSDTLLEPGENWRHTIAQKLESADLGLLLVSPDYLASEFAELEMNTLIGRARADQRLRILPVIVRPSDLEGSPLRQWQWLPRGGRAVSTWRSRDEAWVEVTTALRNIVDFRVSAAGSGSPRPDRPVVGAPTVPVEPGGEANHEEPMSPGVMRPIGEIFRRGTPEITFVEPEQFPLLKAHLRTMGVGLVVAGPSGIGKTTAVKKALQWVGDGRPVVSVHALSRQDLALLDRTLDGTLVGHLVVDDFHHLDGDRKRSLAVAMKILADRGVMDAKITVIGINAAGASLLHELRDLGGRFDEIYLTRQSDERIATLIAKGESAANVAFARRDEFVNAAGGSFSAAQQLCFHACLVAGVERTSPTPATIPLGVSQILGSLQSTLEHNYRGPLLAFCAHDRLQAARGACLALLWLLGQDRERSAVVVEEAALQYPEFELTLRWLRDGGLTQAFTATPALKALLHFELTTAVLSADDPLLVFYLRNLEWPDFARTSTGRKVIVDPSGVLVFLDRVQAAATGHGGPATSGTTSDPRVNISTNPLGADPTGVLVAGGSSARGAAAHPDAWFLHLSDLHFEREEQAVDWYNQLAEDLRDLRCERLSAVVLSGDITNRASAAEFGAARLFLQRLMDELRLSSRRVVIVPGNHDIDWEASRKAYPAHHRSLYGGKLIEGQYIDGGALIAVRDDDLYQKRFTAFSTFYESVKRTAYSLEYADQAVLEHFPEDKVLILGLNSAWQTDHHHSGRASIHNGALSRALSRIRSEPLYRDCLCMAVWHHPLAGSGEDRIKDAGFLEQLAKAGFRLGLHGHIHQARNDLFRYDMETGGRRLDLVCAGTFGAPSTEWVPGYPLGYNLLQVRADRVTVHTRRREEVNGAWKPDARWSGGGGKDPRPRYDIEL